MGGWLLDAAKGKSTGEPPAGLRADFGEQIGALQLRAQVAKEILANLQHVEQVLDAFARDPSKRATLCELQPYMRQMHGALVGARLQARRPRRCRCASAWSPRAPPPGHARVAEDMDWIAEGLSSLGFFLEPCRHGREPVDEAIALFFRRYEKRDAPALGVKPPRLQSPVKRPGPTDHAGRRRPRRRARASTPELLRGVLRGGGRGAAEHRGDRAHVPAVARTAKRWSPSGAASIP